MSSVGFPIFVVTTLIAGTAAAIIMMPKDMLRSTVVKAPVRSYVSAPITPVPQAELLSTGTAVPTVQFAALTVSVTPLEPQPVVETAPLPAASQDIRLITAGSLNMRTGPNKDAGLVASLPRGTRVSVTEMSGSWAFVSTADGTTGWLSQNFLAPAGE